MHLKAYTKQFLNNTFGGNKPQFLIFFVTSRCNCRCGSCFYWRKLNKTDELSLEEIRKISSSIGDFHTLLLSGGEPFLRNDIFEICQAFIETNHIKILSVPTNCTEPGRTLDLANQVIRRYPHLRLSINPSLDGLALTHDRMRGSTGIFDKVVQTLEKLSRLKEHYSNLEIIVNTVVTNENATELGPLMDFVYANFDVDEHDLELLRGDHKDKALTLPYLDEIRLIHRLSTANKARYLARKKAGRIERFASLGLALLSQKIKEDHLAGKSWPFVCSAGKNIGVIYPDGDVGVCELLPAVGNLRDQAYDFYRVWNSPKAGQARSAIQRNACGCTHVCFIKLTASRYWRSLFLMGTLYRAAHL